MARYIIKIGDSDRSYYMEWSTIVDAPVTWGMSIEEFREYYLAEYGRRGAVDLDGRLARVEEVGTSSRMDSSADSYFPRNRAGSGETGLTKEQVIDYYCRRKGEGEMPTGSRWWAQWDEDEE